MIQPRPIFSGDNTSLISSISSRRAGSIHSRSLIPTAASARAGRAAYRRHAAAILSAPHSRGRSQLLTSKPHAMQQCLITRFGAERVEARFDGEIDQPASALVRRAFELFERLLLLAQTGVED